jgi:hypothetical protein
MALEYALEWLRGPLLDIRGVLDIVASFIFQFKGVRVRDLPHQSTIHPIITCLEALSDGLAVGDTAGTIGIYDSQCVGLLKTYHQQSPVHTIAAYGADNGFVCNSWFGVTFHKQDAFESFYSHDGHQVFKLITFPDGLIASCSKISKAVHIYIRGSISDDMQFRYLHSLTGNHRAADIVRCGDLLAVVYQAPGVVWLLDALTGMHVQTLPLACNYVCDLAFPTKDLMVVLDTTMCLHTYSLTAQCFEPPRSAYHICTIPDGQLLTLRALGNHFYILDSSSHTIVSNHDETPLEPANISRMVYVPSGFVVMCQEGRLAVWR